MKINNKSEYWKSVPEYYDIDEKGNVFFHEDAPIEVKKSYKQYQIEQSMMSFFVEEEEVEEKERTFALNDEQQSMVNNFLESEKIEREELKKDYSMYLWQQHHKYYTKNSDDEIVFHEDTPVEILASYKAYHKQLEKLEAMKYPKGFSFKDFFDMMNQYKGK